ncbi:hypothetical protein Taro_034553 [Colocasia esculenta]|uniref:SAM domain-containing protein n=1 Tax=Colocasia esculenta TaxID=4460 RepID=A0A843WC97_COLES|nr:hypothetical protein [Colocasia esculenta]
MLFNPRPPAPPETLSLTLAMSDDDDDFQDPFGAVSLAQTLIPSAHAVATKKRKEEKGHAGPDPLRPSRTANRPPKRAKSSSFSAGKENRDFPEKVRSGSGAAGGHGEERKTKGAALVEENGRCLEGMEPPSAGCGEKREVSAGNEGITGSDGCEGGSGGKEEEMGFSVPIVSEVEISGAQAPQSGKTDACWQNEVVVAQRGSYCSMSIEGRLLGSSFETSGVDESEGFEAGTQLNELMNLCSAMHEEENEDGGIAFAKRHAVSGENLAVLAEDSVQCPLCGTDITDLGEELRLAHTNVQISTDASKPCVHQPATDAVPVIEWLRMLGLSKYEEAFVREEIDWDTLQWLTEEDLLNLGIAALGPRKKIVHALNELRKGNSHKDNSQVVVSKAAAAAANDKTRQLSGNKLITEYFQGSAADRNRGCRDSKTPQSCGSTEASNRVERIKKSATRKAVTGRICKSNGRFKDIPSWCCIPGTPFRVDAFRYLRGDCSHWFLTHFHLDHYQGLTRNFCHGKIYCSSITAHLLNLKIGIPWERLHVLPLNQKITIAGVDLTCLDANHCPGSIIILFESPNGKPVLHTGDFRFCEEMSRSLILRSCHVHTLILDTTYCNPQYDFPKQEAVIQFVIEAIQAEAFNPKTLFLIGSYTIGKERLFLEVARVLRKKVYVGAAKLRLLQCLGLPEEDLQWFTVNEMESHIHVVPMWTIASFKRMKHITKQYSNQFNLIVAFSPTGWTCGKGKKRSPGRRWQQGTIIRYEVPYSEHSSFPELREFVKLLSPDNIIPSVNNDGPESADAMVGLLTSETWEPSGN